MWKMTLSRRLMVAVTPWAGSAVQARARRVKSEASRKSKVEFIFKHLQTASLKSTPLFTLFIQLLRIDVDGCMKTIQKRKSRQLELLKAVAGQAGGPAQASPSQDPTAQSSCHVGTSKKLVPLKAKEGPLPAHLRPAFLTPGPAPKPKTVSQLLKEKRLREWKAKRALSKRVVLAPPQLLLPSSVIIRPPAQAGGPGLPTAATGPSLPGLSPVAASASPGSSGQRSLALSREPVGGRKGFVGSREDGRGKEGGSQKDSQGVPAPARSAPLLPKQPHLPLQILAAKPPTPVASLSPTSVGPGTKKSPRLAPAACAQGPAGSQQHSVQSVPPLVAPLPGSHEAAKQILPITWLLTAQSLIPMTVVSLPSPGESGGASGLGVSPALSQAAEASPVSAGPVAVGQPWRGAFPSSLQKDGKPGLTLPSVPLVPAVSTELQRTLPPTCPLMPPLPSAAVGSVQNSTHLNRGPQNYAGRSSRQPTLPEGTKDPPEKACPPLPLLREKATPDYSLLSLEDLAAVKEWAKGDSGPRAPALETSLPYLPPFLCSLRALSALLLNKAALEQTAAPLVTPQGQQEASQRLDLAALREVVHQKLQENPAYQLLKARFLAAFSVPAAFAVLSPPRVTTTLSGERWWESSHRGDSSTSASSSSSTSASPSSSEDEEDRREAGGVAERLEEPGTDRIGMPGVRRSTRLRRRRRHL